MTPQEVTSLLSDLHDEGLINEPTDIESQLKTWFLYFKNDEARVIYKACYIYIHIRHNKFFPHPSQIEELKQRAIWLLEIDDREAEEKRRRTLTTEKKYIPGGEEHCPMVKTCFLYLDLCDGPENNKCPFEGV